MVIKRLNAETPDADLLAKEMQRAIAGETHLSYRSYTEVFAHIQRGEVYLKLLDGQITSFLFATPLDQRIVELHSFFTFPKFRHQAHFSRLLEYVIAEPEKTYCAVTFHPDVCELLLKKAFHLSSFAELPWPARFRFVLRRLRWRRIVSIVVFMSKEQPMYLIKNLCP